MRQLILILTLFVFTQANTFAQEEPAYFEVGKTSGTIEAAAGSVTDALRENGFRIIGEYTPAGNENLAVVCYTHPELEKIALTFADRGALAAALKVGLKKDGNSVKVSMINPMYLFYAYFVDGIDKQEKSLRSISENAKTALKKVGTDFIPFGGTLKKDKLQKYRYKVMMPYFTDAEEMKTFDSFEEGLKTIQANLADGKGETEKVYELMYADKQTAVFGVGLKNAETGEAKFLPIIGDDHVAAMPYEIILQGKKATILPGRYRIALHWPELTMGTFMKIMSTPGDIAETMKGLTE